MKTAEDFKVGHTYQYSDIPTDGDKVNVLDHGEDLLGANAIHVRYDNENHLEIKDVWFIYVSQGMQGFFKCVYNG